MANPRGQDMSATAIASGQSATKGPACEAVSDPVAQFRPLSLKVNEQRIIRLQGYPPARTVPPIIRYTAEWAARTAEADSVAVVCYRRVPIQNLGYDELVLKDGTALRCPAFSRYLARASHAVLFVMTVGRVLDVQCTALAQRGKLLEALLLQIAGSLALDDVTRRFKHQLMTEAATQGRRVGLRMGPGYSYHTEDGIWMWPLENQAALFGAFGSTALPVELWPSSMMQPKLSRSGLYAEHPTPDLNL